MTKLASQNNGNSALLGLHGDGIIEERNSEDSEESDGNKLISSMAI